MNDQKNIIIYLRKTNGSGEKISINPLINSKQLYNHVAQIFNMEHQGFELYSKGKLVNEQSDQSLASLKIDQQSIIHVKERKNDNADSIQLKVFCQGSLYSYEAFKNQTIQNLKQQISSRLGCNIHHITISHLGKEIEDSQTLEECQVQDKDIVSIFISPSNFGRVNSTRLKPKLAESLTFAPSQQIDLTYQPFSKQVMRKSSMKSSHESRQFKIQQSKKLFLNVIRPKSERNLNEDEPKFHQNLCMLNCLSSQKMIETQSINLDDPQQEQGPESWKQCKIQIQNEIGTLFYTLQCAQDHNLQAIIAKLAKCERQNPKNIFLMFPNQINQKQAQQGKTLLQIAKNNQIKIIHNVLFKVQKN